MHAFVSSINLLHCICMIIFEPFQFSDSKKVKKKYQKSPSKSHSWSCPWWVFQTRHTSKFCSAKKMAESPCFVSVLLLEESFAVTYHNSRVRRVNSFQTSFFSPKIMKFIFFDPQDIFYQNLYALQEQFQSSLKVVR